MERLDLRMVVIRRMSTEDIGDLVIERFNAMLGGDFSDRVKVEFNTLDSELIRRGYSRRLMVQYIKPDIEVGIE